MNPGLVELYASLSVYEFQYAPGNKPTGLCVGVGTTPGSGTPVTLQPCGVTVRTTWILDPHTTSAGSYDALISGATDTNFSQPLLADHAAGRLPLFTVAAAARRTRRDAGPSAVGLRPWRAADALTLVTRILLVGAGSLITVAGVVFTLQGVGVIGGSFMSGTTTWAVAGPVIALAGLGLVAAGLRRGRRVTRRPALRITPAVRTPRAVARSSARR